MAGVLIAIVGVMIIVWVQYYSDYRVLHAPAESFVADEDDLEDSGTILVVRLIGLGLTVFGLGVAALSTGLTVLLRAK